METLDRRRLQYTTSNFVRLQGLREVAAGVTMLLAIGAMNLPRPWDSWSLAPLFLLVWIAWWRIGVYYEHRLGRVEEDPATNWRRLRKYGVFLAFWLAVLAIAFRPTFLIGPEVLFGFLLLLVYYLENRRWYWVVFALPFFALAILDRDHRHLGIMMGSTWLFAVTLIVGGLFDHRYLIRSLPGVQPHGDA